MAFKENKSGFNAFKKAVAGGLEDAVIDIVGQIKENFVPRNTVRRPPKNENAPVSGNLKDATTRSKQDELHYQIGVDAGHPGEGKSRPVEYGEYLEFGTRKMQPRPFLRNGAEETKERFQQIFRKGFQNRFH